MPKHIPLASNCTKTAVLLLNGEADRQSIVDCAEHRLGAAKDLIDALSKANVTSGIDGQDLCAVASALSILMSDAQDLFRAAFSHPGRAEGSHD